MGIPNRSVPVYRVRSHRLDDDASRGQEFRLPEGLRNERFLYEREPVPAGHTRSRARLRALSNPDLRDTEVESESQIPDYGRVFSGPGGSFAFLESSISAFLPKASRPLRILDVGCGNGYWTRRMTDWGHRVVGVDASPSRIARARLEVPESRFERLDISRDIVSQLDEEPFDVVISTEVIEHLYEPEAAADACLSALRPGGRFICSTPYHGYLKNLAIALSGSWDRHHHTLRAVGHIKFFSTTTLRELLDRAGFQNIRFRGAGRMPYLWKSMVMAAERPA